MLRKVQTVETQLTRLMRIQRGTRTPSITGPGAVLTKNLAAFCLCPESVGGYKHEDDEVICLAQGVSRQVVFRLVLEQRLSQRHCGEAAVLHWEKEGCPEASPHLTEPLSS